MCNSDILETTGYNRFDLNVSFTDDNKQQNKQQNKKKYNNEHKYIYANCNESCMYGNGPENEWELPGLMCEDCYKFDRKI